jgi:hypothetical protein
VVYVVKVLNSNGTIREVIHEKSLPPQAVEVVEAYKAPPTPPAPPIDPDTTISSVLEYAEGLDRELAVCTLEVLGEVRMPDPPDKAWKQRIADTVRDRLGLDFDGAHFRVVAKVIEDVYARRKQD